MAVIPQCDTVSLAPEVRYLRYHSIYCNSKVKICNSKDKNRLSSLKLGTRDKSLVLKTAIFQTNFSIQVVISLYDTCTCLQRSMDVYVSLYF